MSFSQVNLHFEELKKDLQGYINNRFAFLQLRALKKTTQITTRIIKLSVGIFLFLFFLGMLSIGGAILLGEYYDNMSLGFFIVAGVYFVLLLIVLLFGKALFKATVLKKVSLKMIKVNKIKI